MKIGQQIAHGECRIKKIESLPETAKPLKVSDWFKAADSETVGNYHVVDNEEGVDFFEKEGQFFMTVEEEAKVRCLDAKRHSTQTIPAGTYAFGIAKEYDHLSQSVRDVAD